GGGYAPPSQTTVGVCRVWRRLYRSVWDNPLDGQANDRCTASVVSTVINSAGAIGLASAELNPAAMAWRRSSERVCGVSAITGVPPPLSPGNERIFVMTSYEPF